MKSIHELTYAKDKIEQALPFLDDKHRYEAETILKSLRSDISWMQIEETDHVRQSVYSGSMGQ